MTSETKTDVLATAPLFSILIPAYNAGHTLPRALDSLLAQTYQSWECFIVDDGSTDNTIEILKHYREMDERFDFCSQENAGTASALDVAAKKTHGQFLVQFGADDELLPDYCEKTAQLMAREPNFDIYAANAWQMLSNGKRQLFNVGECVQNVTSFTLEDLIMRPQIYGTAAVRREVYLRVGGFQSPFLHEDYVFWLKALITGARHVFQPETLSVYHVSESQKTNDVLQNRKADLDIISDLARSEHLSDAEHLAIVKRKEELKRNIATREKMYRIFGRDISEKLIALRRST